MTENEMLTASCENLEPSPITPTNNKSKGNADDAKLTEDESSLDVLNFSTNHAMIEQILVEPSLDLSLSQDDFLHVPCDKDGLHDHAISVLKPHTCAKFKHVNHIATDMDELKLLSSLNTIGYIEFDVLCNLSYLEEKLFVHADLPWFSRYTNHAIGKYNNKGQYLIHRVYICTNLNSPFVVQNYHQLERCNNNNIVMPCSCSSVLNKRVESKEGEHMFLVSTNLLQTSIDKDRVHSDRGDYMLVGQQGLQLQICGQNLSHNIVRFHFFGNLACLHVVQDRLQVQSTPRTAFRQEGEDDEDMTPMHMTMSGAWYGGAGG